MSQFQHLSNNKNRAQNSNRPGKKIKYKTVNCPHYKINRDSMARLSNQISGIFEVKLKEPYCRHVGPKSTHNIFFCTTCLYLGCEEEHVEEHYQSEIKKSPKIHSGQSGSANHSIFFRVQDKNSLQFFCCICKGIIRKDSYSSDEISRTKKIANTVMNISNSLLSKAEIFNSQRKKREEELSFRLGNSLKSRGIESSLRIVESFESDSKILMRVFPDIRADSTIRELIRPLNSIIMSRNREDDELSNILKRTIYILKAKEFDISVVAKNLLEVINRQKIRNIERGTALSPNRTPKDSFSGLPNRNLSPQEERNISRSNMNIKLTALAKNMQLDPQSSLSTSSPKDQVSPSSKNPTLDDSSSVQSQISAFGSNNREEMLGKNSKDPAKLQLSADCMTDRTHYDKIRKDFARIGIHNFGLTCHFNSLFQLLISCGHILGKIEFISKIRSIPVYLEQENGERKIVCEIPIDSSANEIASQFMATFLDYTKRAKNGELLYPGRFIDLMIAKGSIDIYSEQDICEIMDFLLSKIDSQICTAIKNGILRLEESKHYDKQIIRSVKTLFDSFSPLEKLFNVQIKNKEQCQECGFTSPVSSISPYYILFPISSKNLTIQELIFHATQQSFVDCPRCGKNTLFKSTDCLAGPEYLCIGIQRTELYLNKDFNFDKVTLQLKSDEIINYNIFFVILYVEGDVRHYFGMFVDPPKETYKVINDGIIEDISREDAYKCVKSHGRIFVYAKK
ncbi:MAG: hypothetical protein MHMPM18_001598 [Marteilia pararefringens]